MYLTSDTAVVFDPDSQQSLVGLLLEILYLFNPELAYWYENTVKESVALGLDITAHVQDLYDLVDDLRLRN